MRGIPKILLAAALIVMICCSFVAEDRSLRLPVHGPEQERDVPTFPSTTVAPVSGANVSAQMLSYQFDGRNFVLPDHR